MCSCRCHMQTPKITNQIFTRKSYALEKRWDAQHGQWNMKDLYPTYFKYLIGLLVHTHTQLFQCDVQCVCTVKIIKKKENIFFFLPQRLSIFYKCLFNIFELILLQSVNEAKSLITATENLVQKSEQSSTGNPGSRKINACRKFYIGCVSVIIACTSWICK